MTPEQIGRQAAAELRARWPALGPEALAAKLGVDVCHIGRASMVCGRRVWAEYDAGKRRITTYGGPAADRPKRVAHELYHHLEATGVCQQASRADSETSAEAFALALEDLGAVPRTRSSEYEG